MNVQYNRPTYTPGVSFCALKKSQFSGIDFAVVEKFKAPIEKFDSMQDFLEWTSRQYHNISRKNYEGRNYATMLKRESMVCDWDQELSLDSRYTYPEKLVIMNGITKDMNPKDETICPVFNKGILNKTLDELKENLKKDKKYQFDFGKLYKSNLREMYTKNASVDANEAKWVIIPSKINDPEHFNENVEKLQTLSCHEWCTKNGGARIYLHDGDMHIYMDHGKPKLAIRFDEDIVKEVNSELNDYKIPKEYIGILDEYMKKNDFLTTKRVDNVLNDARISAESEHIFDDAVEPKSEPVKSKSFWSHIISFFK